MGGVKDRSVALLRAMAGQCRVCLYGEGSGRCGVCWCGDARVLVRDFDADVTAGLGGLDAAGRLFPVLCAVAGVVRPWVRVRVAAEAGAGALRRSRRYVRNCVLRLVETGHLELDAEDKGRVRLTALGLEAVRSKG